MPTISRQPAPGAAPADPQAWRPQIARQPRRVPTIADPIVEPAWDGLHVLVHFRAPVRPQAPPSLTLIDEEGDDVTDVEPTVSDALRGAILAVDAVVDGWLTTQATHSGEGATIAERFRPSRLAFLTGNPGELEVPPLPDDGPRRAAFVAIDLLSVDGQSLLDVPLLERKRLLEGVLRVEDLVRITPFARPPLHAWLLTWKASGFAGALLKAANSRYEPGAVAPDWAYISTPEGRQR